MPDGREFVRWDAPGVEHAEDGEDALIEEIGRQINAEQQAVYNACRHAYTGTHVKGHAIVKGTLTIEKDLPPAYAQGLFANGGAVHPVALRYSSEPTHVVDDREQAPRGIGMKVFDVDGAKMPFGPDGGGDTRTQDFEFNSAAAIELGNARICRDIIALRQKHAGDRAALDAALRARDDYAVQDGRNHIANAPLVSMDMHSQAALRHGDFVAKHRLRPASQHQRAAAAQRIGARDDAHNAHTDGARAYFAQHAAEYDYQVQLLEDLAAQPVEDGRVEWDGEKYPFVTVARLRIEPQESYAPARLRKWEALVISPWQGLDAHRPLGSINRVRKGVYAASGKFRRHLNAIQPEYISSIDQIP